MDWGYSGREVSRDRHDLCPGLRVSDGFWRTREVANTAEALSALCRRAFERRRQPPALGAVLGRVRTWHQRGQIVFGGLESQSFGGVLDIVEQSRGELNFNDARLVVLQRAGTIGEGASFDPDFDRFEGFSRIS